jgi:hypothetical protein
MRRFHTGPEPAPDIGPFYILALSQKHVRFYACTGESVKERPLGAKTPTSLKEAERFVDLSKELHAHSVPSSSKPNLVTHGHGVGREDEKVRIREFIESVAHGVKRQVRNDDVPLVLAMVAYEASMFKRAIRCTNCVDEIIAGNTDLLSAKQLHAKALAILAKRGPQGSNGRLR